LEISVVVSGGFFGSAVGAVFLEISAGSNDPVPLHVLA
jgi:hypothetical protein